MISVFEVFMSPPIFSRIYIVATKNDVLLRASDAPVGRPASRLEAVLSIRVRTRALCVRCSGHCELLVRALQATAARDLKRFATGGTLLIWRCCIASGWGRDTTTRKAGLIPIPMRACYAGARRVIHSVAPLPATAAPEGISWTGGAAKTHTPRRQTYTRAGC